MKLNTQSSDIGAGNQKPVTRYRNSTPQSPLPLIAALALVSFFIFLYTPFSGDDLAYGHVFGGVRPLAGQLGFVRWAGSHYLTANGRLANYLMPFLAVLPRVVIALICSAMIWLMYRQAVALAAPGLWRRIACVAALALLLPWWDSMNVFDCQLNYIWATALSLLAVHLILRGRCTAWTVLLCFAGGMMHEAATLPLLIALGVYVWVGGKLARNSRLLIVAFAGGCFIATFSPGIIARAQGTTSADASLPVLLAVNGWATLLLWVGILLRSLRKGGRKWLLRLPGTICGLLAVASVIGLVISLKSGIIGRSAWFAQVQALVAMTYALPRLRATLPLKCLAGCLAALAIGIGIWQAGWQHSLYKEFEEMTRQYKTSADGLVYLDYTRDPELPLPLRGRLRSVIDPDDLWLSMCMQVYYDKPPLLVLPEQARGLLPLRADTTLACGDRLTMTLPAGKSIGDLFVIETYLLPGDTIARALPAGSYYLSARQRDPGD